MKTILVLSILLGGMAFAQQDQVPATDLIEWSAMQTPEQLPPAPGVRPDPQPETQPPAHPEQAQAPQAAPESHTVTGSISKDGDSYVLKVSDTTSYKLDDQAKAKEFEGQKVRVTGEVDLNRNFIHVQKIEPLA